MPYPRYYLSTILFLFFVIIGFSCGPKEKREELLIVREDSVTGLINAEKTRANTAIQIADGLKIDLWASDSLAPDPIALSIDDHGNVFLTRTNRQKNSEFDIRSHIDWMTASISLQSTEDRRQFLRSTFAPEKSDENTWLKDLNGDGSHDWRDLTVEKDEVWKLEDQNGDGLADISTRVVNDFNEEISDVAGALLVREEDMFVGIGPDMWRLRDLNNDGVMDEKTSIANGFAVHIGFGGHGMSGAVEGPDGRIYYGIGDIGANITTVDGKNFNYPNQGVLVRSNPDGTDFEVFAAGLRNTHEFSFDEYGNIIGADNDGDHAGESERLVYIVEGSDQGWRTNWQFGKYTDPKNNSYKVWMDEKLFVPRWEGQAAYIIPPIQNFHNGPTGMIYNPGTALGPKWDNKFFLVEFVGTPARSKIWSFSLRTSGASFELEEEQEILSGVLPTGIRFGPDGAMYIADWVMGWNTKNYGRIWRLDVTDEENSRVEKRKETLQLMSADYLEMNNELLGGLLAYEDMRIRQKTQFELVKRGENSIEIFKNGLNSANQFARIHSIWGLAQLHRSGIKTAPLIVPLLSDTDAEIVAQTAKTLGDLRFAAATSELIPLLTHGNSRVRFFAVQALGRIGDPSAGEEIFNLIEANNNEDHYIRHAAVLALSRIGAENLALAQVSNQSAARRLAAALVLRRLRSENISEFLQDPDEYIVLEAARAINDDFSIPNALPSLAAILKEQRFSSEPLIRRAINACLRVGTDTELKLLMDFSNREDADIHLRAEAVETLATWHNPSLLDRVDGRYRGEIHRDIEVVREKLGLFAKTLLNTKEKELLIAGVHLVEWLEMKELKESLSMVFKKSTDWEIRYSSLSAIFALSEVPEDELFSLAMKDVSPQVRSLGLSNLSPVISANVLNDLKISLMKNGSIEEQQEFIGSLGGFPIDKSAPLFGSFINDLEVDQFPQALLLDLGEAINSSGSQELISQFQAAHLQNSEGMEKYDDALYGGNSSKGEEYFFNNATGQCTRCHKISSSGADVGPALTHIGDDLSREQLLEALVDPSARISPGYGTVILTLTDGQNITGVLLEENEDQIILKTTEAEPLEIPKARIDKRQNLPSAMPPMGTLMSRRELRDLIEYLAGLNEN